MGVDVSLDSLTVKIGGQRILDSVTVDLQEGQFISVVGLSGSGKTTLLKAIAGLLDAEVCSITGSVAFDGIARAWRDPSDVNIGMMFQKPFLFPWASAADNVRLASRLHPTESNRKRVKEAIEMVEMTEHQNKLPYQLSGGMQQRIALAREFARQPDVLLLDEPFSSLDCVTKEHLHVSLLRYWEAVRPTIVFVTHDPGDAVVLGDRLMVLKDGQLPPHSQISIDLGRSRSGNDRNSPSFYETVAWTIEKLRGADVRHP